MAVILGGKRIEEIREGFDLSTFLSFHSLSNKDDMVHLIKGLIHSTEAIDLELSYTEPDILDRYKQI